MDKAIAELQRKLYITMIEARYEPTLHMFGMFET